MGFLTGIAFALFYTCAGIPIARLADRGARRTIIAVGLAVWSAMTAVSGLVRSFTELALARIGVGVGEAACVPPAHSLLSDYFPPERRATALAVFSMGVHVGVAFGFLLGGWIAEYFGWRRAFFAVGIPGIVLAVLVRLTIREPERGHAEGRAGEQHDVTVGDAFRLLGRVRSFRHLALAAALHSFGGYAFAVWGPPFFIRVHAMEMSAVGTWLGAVLGIGGAVGAFSGGRLADRLGIHDVRWQLWLPAIATLLQIPFVLLVLTSAAPLPAMLYLVPSAVLSAMWFGPVFALTQALVPIRMRATAAAVLVFVINLIGLGLGPQAVGILNDLFAATRGSDAIRYSLFIIAFANVWAAGHFLTAARTVRADLSARAAAT
jgi:predicted MFS family arabinose efflux permease